MSDIPEIAPTAAADLLKKGQAVLVDVRELGEYREAHIKEAYLLPLSTLSPQQFLALPLENRVLIIQCRSGARSFNTCRLLAEIGFPTPTYNLAGGILAWKEAGLPIEE